MNCFSRAKIAIEKIAQKFIQIFWEPEYNLFEEEDSVKLLSPELTDKEKEKYKEYRREFKENEEANKEIDDWIKKNEHNLSDDWVECDNKINQTVDSDGEFTAGF